MDPGYMYKNYGQHGSIYPQMRNNLPAHSSSQQFFPAAEHKPTLAAREDFTGLDNDALDFSQLEDFIANETDANGSYFADTLANSEASKHTPSQSGQVIRNDRILVTSIPSDNGAIQYVGTKPCPPGANVHRSTMYPHGTLPHNLPDSPPDSGSEPPYSPTDPGSRSPSHKGSNITGRRNLHDLLLHPLYPQPATGPILSLRHHDMGSPLPHIPPIHVPPLIPVSPTSANSGGSPSANSTLTTLDSALSVSSRIPLESSSDSLVTQQPTSQSQPSSSKTLSNSQEDVIPYFTQLQPVSNESIRGRKRKSSGSGNSNNGKINMIHVKQEPELSPEDSESSNNNSNNGNGSTNGMSGDDEMGFDMNGDIFMDPNYQCIKFQPFQDNTWHTLTDDAFNEMPPIYFKVDADKGFNFSNADDAFVCQKKNHFQITCHAKSPVEAKFVKAPDGYKLIEDFYVHFYGVKAESPNQSIKIEQSQSDRSKKPFHPVHMEMNSEHAGKITVGRLHFNETTSNNMRKKGKPNPDQRYFYLVVALHAHCADGNYAIMAQSSQRIIVRASNPGQFESDMELSWQKGNTTDSIYHAGRVGINTDRPEEALVVYGNCKITGQIIHPSDMRAKENITEVDCKEQLKNVQQLRVVRYKYNPQFARLIGLSEKDAVDTGVIAQEVQKVIPEAVKETGDIELPNGEKISNFLVVNKERIFMENIGAVKELCKVTGKLETRIDRLEKITKVNMADAVSCSSFLSSTSSPQKNFMTKESHGRTSDFVCSNKCVQLLIVILVLIMAFCLVAMATLYMLEYHKRSTYDYYHHSNHHLFNSSHAYLNPDTSRNPYEASNFPGYQSPSTYSVHSVLIPNQSTKFLKNPSKTSSSEKGADASEYYSLVKPKVLGKPSNCFPTLPYLETNCETFCCTGSKLQGTSSDYLDIERQNHVALTGGSNFVRHIPTSSSSTSQLNNNTEDAISVVSPNNPVHRNGLDAKRRKRRQIAANPKIIKVPSIRMLSVNIDQKLDPTYCMINSIGYHDCVSTENRHFSSANLTYHVPLSKYWDELNISLIFSFPSQYNVSKPQICHKTYTQPYCRLDESNNVQTTENQSSYNNPPETKNAFPISLKVGRNPYSRFSIRFSLNTDDFGKLCTLTRNVFEFNFHFYRVCHE